MNTSLSQVNTKSTTQKNFRSRSIIATKRIAYQELMHPDNKTSQRSACKLIRISRGTFQRWEKRPLSMNDLDAKENEFFESPEGTICLHRIVLAATMTIRYGSSGVRGIQEFLQLSKLERWIASSTGALQGWVSKTELAIVEFGQEQKLKLSEGMPKRKISICQDENFHESVPCLVAIEPVSNYILVEKMVEDRTKEEWTKAIDEGLIGLNVEVIQSTSDEGSAILAHVKHELKAEHSPDLFHVQQELGRATAFPLKAQEKEFEKAAEAAHEKSQKMIIRHGRDSVQAQEAQGLYNLKLMGLSDRKKRREEVGEAKRAIGECYHPVDLKTGKLQSVEWIEAKLNSHVEVIEKKCREAELSESSLKRVKKAKGMISAMVAYFRFFFLVLRESLELLGMQEEELLFFREVMIPLVYLEESVRKQPCKKRKEILGNLEALRALARDGPWSEDVLLKKLSQAREMVQLFQRSSSCVEGRNGVLALKHHSFHKLSKRTLNALTVIHNYHVKRSDGSTAAERFFGKKSDDLFEYVRVEVPMLGRPRPRSGQGLCHKVAA